MTNLAVRPSVELQINADKLLELKESDVAAIMKHYEVTEAMVKESMVNIRQWYEMQPHLPQGAMDDNELLRHLAIRGFSTERAKEKIDHYYNARNVVSEITNNRDPCSKEINKVFDSLQMIVLPKKTPENYRVSIYRFINDDPNAVTAWDVFKLAFMIADYRLENDMTLGEHFIVDMSKVKLGHVLQMTPSIMNKANYYAYTCVGAKVKGVHLVGLPPYAEAMVSMFKKSIPKKIAERICTYPQFEDLKQKFPVSILPKDMGGEEMSSEEICAAWKDTLQSPAWRKWFIEQDKVRTDESKRDKKNPVSVATEELLGMQGSFRKLDLD